MAYGRRPAADQGPADDPLAELARLIGQEDPFAEFFNANEARPARPQPAPAREPAARAPAPAPRPAYPAPEPDQPHFEPQPAPRPAERPRGSFSALAAEVYAEPTHRLASTPSRSERHAIEDAARDVNRSLVNAEPGHSPVYGRRVDGEGEEPAFRRPPAQPAPQPAPVRAPEARVAEPRPVERDPRADRAAEAAVAAALGQNFDFEEELRPLTREVTTRPPEVRREPAPQIAPRVERAAPAAPAPARPAPQPAPAAAPARDEGRIELDAGDADDNVYDYGRSAAEHDGYETAAEEEYDEVYDAYEEEQPSRGRRRLFLVAAVAGLAVLGTGAVFGYRALTGSSVVSSAAPPVIRADQGPNKITPAQPEVPAGQAQQDGQKLIYDRVGGDAAPTGNERVVSREEQPVDVNQAAQPRVILPTSNSAPTAKPASPAPLSTLPGTEAAPAPANPTEPKRVRTLTVRADGTVVEAPTAAPAPPAMTDAAPQPMPVAPQQPVAAAPVEPMAPMPADPAPAPAASAPMPANVPLPLPRVAAAPAPAAAAPAPAATAAPATAPAATASTGQSGYFVQIASQRSQADAQAAFRATQSKFPGILGSYSATYRRADLGDRGIYYRAQVGPFAGRDQANQLCQSLRAQGGDCVVQRN
ncbi:SPOR domain-containing protein [Bosea sp. 117]|uniref:SPOR domain-containing protein n=1 Tax=Bosea sp. 117 TaxID=1125973 RepID=UPI00068E1368|nr:SPOR domain-containing protein [Bosea sp. 117]